LLFELGLELLFETVERCLELVVLLHLAPDALHLQSLVVLPPLKLMKSLVSWLGYFQLAQLGGEIPFERINAELKSPLLVLLEAFNHLLSLLEGLSYLLLEGFVDCLLCCLLNRSLQLVNNFLDLLHGRELLKNRVQLVKLAQILLKLIHLGLDLALFFQESLLPLVHLFNPLF